MKFKFVTSGKYVVDLEALHDDCHKDQARCCCLSSDYFITGSYDCKISVCRYDPIEEKYVKERVLEIHEGYVVGLCIIDSTSEIVSVSHDMSMKVYDLKKLQVVKDFQNIHVGAISCVRVSKFNSNELITGSWDHTAKIHLKDTKSCKAVLSHNTNVLSVLRMKDGCLLTGTGDGKIFVWDESNVLRQTLNHHTLSVRSLDYTYDMIGTVNGFLSVANDGYLKLYNSKNELVDSVHAHDNMILSVTSCFDNLIITTSEDRRCHLWRILPSPLLGSSSVRLEGIAVHPNSVWDGALIKRKSKKRKKDVYSVMTVCANGCSYEWNVSQLCEKQDNEEERNKIRTEAEEKLNKQIVLQHQFDHGINPENFKNFGNDSEAIRFLEETISRERSSRLLRHGEFRLFSIDGFVRIFKYDKRNKKWSFYSNFVEFPPEKEEKEEEEEEEYDDDGYESPSEDIDLEYDDAENDKYQFFNRKLQLSFHGMTSIHDSHFDDFKVCDDCGQKVVLYYHCFECVQSVDLCESCYHQSNKSSINDEEKNEKREKSSFHRHNDFNYFSFVSVPRYRSWFDISLSSTCDEVIKKCFRYYEDRPCLGTRESIDKEYRWVTYRSVANEMLRISNGLKKTLLRSRHRSNETHKKYIGVISAPSVSYVCIDLCCLVDRYVSVPIQRVLSVEKKESIIRSTQLSCIFCSEEYIEELFDEIIFLDDQQRQGFEDLEVVVVMSSSSSSSQDRSLEDNNSSTEKIIMKNRKRKNVNFKILKYEDLLLYSFGEEKNDDNNNNLNKNNDSQDKNEENQIVTIVHTSGTTSLPKGVVFRERDWMKYLLRECKLVPLVVMGLFPFSHNSGRFDFLMTFVNGGRIALVTDPGMSTVLNDCAKINPTILSLVPRVMNFVYGCFQDDCTSEIQKEIANSTSKNQDVNNNNNNNSFINKEAKNKVFKEYKKKNVFGCRIPDVSVGGAKSSPKIKRFFRKLLEIPVYDSFGSTEVGLISFNFAYDPSRHKLDDCPDLGYFGTDKPFPRGELLVKTERKVEYFVGRQQQSENVVEEKKKDSCGEEEGKGEGKEEEKQYWYRTGDIVEIRGNKMIVIDRKSNIVKVASGEFISLETVENVISSSCPSISQIVLHPTSVALIGVVVVIVIPNKKEEEEESEGEEEEGKKSIDMSNDQVMKEIQKVGNSHPLNIWEIPTGIVLTREKFTYENGLLTVTKKKIRKKIIKKYQGQLTSLMNDQRRDLRSTNSINEFIRNILGVGTENNNMEEEEEEEEERSDNNNKKKTFSELGGDSLTAIRVMNELKRRGLEISYKDLRETPLSDIFSRIREKKNDDDDDDSGKKKNEDNDVYVTFEKEKKEIEDLMKQLIISNNSIRDTCRKELKNIFLTGSTGYLGQFILRDLLREFSEEVKITCLVRSDKSSRKKIDEFFSEVCEESLIRKKNERVEYVIGDLSKPMFGFSEEEFEVLTKEKSDIIIHNGAMVNHFLPYSDHYDTNVRSLKDIVRLSEGFKRIIYISSVSVYPIDIKNRDDEEEKEEEEEEDDDNDDKLIMKGKHFKRDGYSASKWVGDSLLSALPHTLIVRPSLIFGEMGVNDDGRRRNIQEEGGGSGFSMRRSNLKDWMNIFTKTMLLHKCGPSSNCENHLDVVPVDYVSHVICKIPAKGGEEENMGHRKFNLSVKNFQVSDMVECIKNFSDRRQKNDDDDGEEEEKFTLLPFNLWLKEIERKEIQKRGVKSDFLPFVPVLRMNQRIGGFYDDFFVKGKGREENLEYLKKKVLLGESEINEGQKMIYSSENLMSILEYIFESIN